MLRNYVQKKLEKYAQQYLDKNPDLKLVAVVGSVGKTSTKRAIGDILSTTYRVRMHDGNYNTEFGAPLAILGIEMPRNIRSPFEWLKVFKACKERIASDLDVDVVVQELGSDKPGDIKKFSKYLHPHIAVVTAITPEHMEQFKTIDAVAEEELSVASFSDQVLVNRDDIDGKYAALDTNPNIFTYGTTSIAEYRAEMVETTLKSGTTARISYTGGGQPFDVNVRVLGEHSLRPIAAGIAVALKMGVSQDNIVKGLQLVRAVPGRMNVLNGLNGTTIIDDTYNSSPAAVRAALNTLYLFDDAPQRIAVLGSMNELGDVSPQEHQTMGSLCKGDLLSWVVMVGEQAERYAAPAARANGCQVKICRNAIEAGEFIRSISDEGAVILVKGSQGDIYLEEAVKILCLMSEDVQLVRQSEAWMNIKNAHFSKSSSV